MIKDYFNDCMTLEALEQKHRKLVLQLHPDRNPDKAGATREFQEMQAQYEERKAELNGDYSGSQRARQRREQAEWEEREREERERKEREARRVDDVLNEARRNKGVGFDTYKAGAYVYARKVADDCKSGYDWDRLSGEKIVHVFYTFAAEPETVVKIETIVELDDKDIMGNILSDHLNGIYGGWEILQNATYTDKGKRVPKVVMFRSKHYCFFGNPRGDLCTIFDYYVPVNCADMFSDLLHVIAAEEQRKKAEEQRIAAERRAKLEAEQEPLIAAWSDKLITISAALTDDEKVAVAVSNLKKMLKAKFPGATFRLHESKGKYDVRWADGPMEPEVLDVMSLFYYGQFNPELSPWEERYGHISFFGERPSLFVHRFMSAITKATILEQLGQVTSAFATSGFFDEVEVDDNDWVLLHLLAGVDVNDGCTVTSKLVDGKHMVCVMNAVGFIFNHTSYIKQRKTKKRKAKAA